MDCGADLIPPRHLQPGIDIRVALMATVCLQSSCHTEGPCNQAPASEQLPHLQCAYSQVWASAQEAPTAGHKS